MSAQEIHVERLIGRPVFALNGRSVGRLQEIAIELRKGECYVTEYLIGAYGVFERFAVSEIARTLLRAMRVRRNRVGYRVPWDALDLSDPDRPRLRCSVAELRPLAEEER